jgi:UDP-N-acetylmuramate dehydrogenase
VSPVHRPLSGPRLQELTTLGLGGPCRELRTVTGPQDLRDLGTEPLLVLGGGSNLVVADEGVDLPVLRIAVPGLEVGPDGLVTVGAGEDWDGVVDRMVALGWCGLAPLSGIPGSAGATPVQNVGAYGTEIGRLLVGVTVFDRPSGTVRELGPEDLGLGYRTSTLRGRSDRIVLSVTLRLTREPWPVAYRELAGALGVEIGAVAGEADVRAAVLALRRGKGMVLDPGDPDSRSAGSFFTNPVLDAADADAADAAIRRRLGDVDYPRYPAGGDAVKLSAAWLIERAGFAKGRPGPGGRVGISTKHTLALVNRGGSTADLLALAREIRDGVRSAFDVTLQPEPVLVGVEFD